MDSGSLSMAGIPKLKGRENYTTWKLVINTILEAESFSGANKRAGNMESKTKQLIVTTVSDKILYSLSECIDSKSMFEKLEVLYTNRKDDLDELHTEFQNFGYKNDQSAQENVTRLENTKTKINGLGDTISDSTFRSRLINSLPKRFSSFQSASNLNRKMDIEELIAALIAEDG